MSKNNFIPKVVSFDDIVNTNFLFTSHSIYIKVFPCIIIHSMIINNISAENLNSSPSVHDKDFASSLKAHHAYSPVDNFIANILSKAFVSLYADFYSPLKNPTIS